MMRADRRVHRARRSNGAAARLRIALLISATMLLAFPLSISAHDIPNDVTINVFLKPEGQTLRLLARVPLKACRDVDYPRRGAGFLDIARAGDSLRDAATQWISDDVNLYEGSQLLEKPTVIAVRVSLESDRSFESYDSALDHIASPPLANNIDLYWNQGLLDVLFEYPIRSDQSDFSIEASFAKLGLQVNTVLRFLPPGGAVRAFEITGDEGLIRLDPRWYQAALRFVGAGFLHILGGTDHLLFLFCLVIPFRRFAALIKVVTAFTVAHSITLIASAYNLGPDALWFPAFIETLIAVSIVYMALENIVGAGKVGRRWAVALGFGLIHGFGFSFALSRTLQFAGSHLLTSLLSFNIGVELGQLLVLVLLIPAVELLFRFVVAERIGTIILSAIVAHTGWHWMMDRCDRLRAFGWSALSAATLASAMRWLMALIVLGLIVFLSREMSKNRQGALIANTQEPESQLDAGRIEKPKGRRFSIQSFLRMLRRDEKGGTV